MELVPLLLECSLSKKDMSNQKSNFFSPILSCQFQFARYFYFRVKLYKNMPAYTFLKYFSTCLTILLVAGCGENEAEVLPLRINRLEADYNPNGYSPLTATLKVNTNQAVSATITVKGKDNPRTDISKTYTITDTTLQCLPIVGLYPDYNNQIEVAFAREGELLQTEELFILTTALSPHIPNIEIDIRVSDRIKPGLNLVNSFSNNGEPVPQRPFMFDEEGEVRWYLDYAGHPQLGNLFYDVGLIRLRNGNFAFGDGNSGAIYEVNVFGDVLNSWPFRGFGFHHTLLEKPNGNFVVTVNDWSKPTREDVIIEIDRTSGEIANLWDLNLSLERERRALEVEGINLDVDWFHANGLFYDIATDEIIVSGRFQCVVKLNSSNEVKWILAPHRGWTTSGNGIQLDQFLLTPLDSDNQSITDPSVRDGAISHTDFDWNWFQHSPQILPNGNLLLFDNGFARNYKTWPWYSRAVEYKIDEAAKTVQQVWSYGADRSEIFSSIVSSVRYHEDENTVLMSPGAAGFFGANFGKIIEVDRATNQVLFEATITPAESLFSIVFHSVERMEL